MVPTELVEEATASHQRLLDAIAGMTESDVRDATRLPGWTVAHVLAHLTGNAQGHLRMLEGAVVGQVADQYPIAGMRERDIETGAARPAAELISTLRDTCAALDQAWRSLPDEAWDRLGAMAVGPPRTMVEVLATRVREVEAHHVDLGRGYSPDEWPATFVERELSARLDGLAARTSPAWLLAWLLDRGPAPTLGPW